MSEMWDAGGDNVLYSGPAKTLCCSNVPTVPTLFLRTGKKSKGRRGRQVKIYTSRAEGGTGGTVGVDDRSIAD